MTIGLNGIGAYPLSNLDYQCLAQVLQTPNPLATSFKGGASQSADTTSTQTSQPASQPPQVQYVQPEKKSHTGAWILGGIISAAALIAAGRYGYKNGPATETFLKRIFEGCKSGIQKIGKSTTEKAAETAKEAVTKGKMTISTVGTGSNKKTIVTMSGEKNIISTIANKKNPERSLKTAKTQLTAINEEVEIGQLKNRIIEPKSGAANQVHKFTEGNEMLSFVGYSQIIEGSSIRDLKIIGAKAKDGKIITTVLDAKTGKKVLSGDIEPDIYAKLETRTKDIFAGKLGDGVKYSDFEQVIVRNTNKDTGLVSIIKAQKGKEELLSATTDRFAIDSDDVLAYCRDHKDFKEGLAKFKDKKFDELPVLSKEVRVAGNKTFTFDKDGNVIAMEYTKNGKTISLDAVKDKKQFDARCEEFEQDIIAAQKLPRDRWTNVVYELPS